MSTKFSQSFYYAKYVLSRDTYDEYFSEKLDRFLLEVGCMRPVSDPVGRLVSFFTEFVPTYVFCVCFNRLARKRGYPDYFSADDLERVRNSENQLVFCFME